MDTFKLEPQPDEGDTNNSETLDHAVLDQQVLTQHNKFGFTNSTKKSAKKNDAPGFRALVLIGVAAAFHAAVTPHMTTSSVEASKLAETNHPVAVPPQWLPVLLANHAPNAPPAPPCTNNGTGGTTGRGAWPPHPVDPSSVQCVDVMAGSPPWHCWPSCSSRAGVWAPFRNPAHFTVPPLLRMQALLQPSQCFRRLPQSCPLPPMLAI